MIKAGILGASGYAGAELVRLLGQRDDVELVFVHSNQHADASFSIRYPHLKKLVETVFITMDDAVENYFNKIDVLFCALPHGASQKAVKAGVANGLKVIDLSADFRIQDTSVYEEWYEVPHTAADLLPNAVYGLPEIHRESIQKTNIVANPGCYPTSILLGLYPLFAADFFPKETIISDSKSGLSGAGRGLKDGNLFAQATENIHPYSVGSHRHTPEIKEQLTQLSGQPTSLMFVPHLVPMQRGILSTIYVKNEHDLTETQLYDLYQDFVTKNPFVRLLDAGETPHTKAVSGSNYCDLSIKIDSESNTIIIMSAIDNLLKGASGQAIQNMNLMFGLEETKGLTQMPIWP